MNKYVFGLVSGIGLALLGVNVLDEPIKFFLCMFVLNIAAYITYGSKQ